MQRTHPLGHVIQETLRHKQPYTLVINTHLSASYSPFYFTKETPAICCSISRWPLIPHSGVR